MSRAERFWDRLAGSFEPADGELGENEGRLLDKARHYLQPGDQVLDLGCAAGAMAFALADEVGAVHGVDISGKMIAAARRQAAERGATNVHFEQATLFDEHLKPGSFDAILALNVLHFLPETEQVMARLYTLLKPGGVVISATACIGEKRFSLMFLSVFLLSKLRILPRIHFFKTSELEAAFVAGGFELIETERMPDEETSATIYFVAARKGAMP